MLKIEYAYWLIAALLVCTAWRNLRERQWARAAFWMLLALPFGGGDAVLAAQRAGHALPAQLAGGVVLALALLAPRLKRSAMANDGDSAARAASAQRQGHWLLLPALLIPLVTVLVALFGEHLRWGGWRLFAAPQLTLTGLALACVVALLAALRVTRAPLHSGLEAGSRLLDAIGWAALLPLLLAALGTVFTHSGVGKAIAQLTTAWLPAGSATACLLTFALGMVAFTVIMGNAFAAFPVMMAGIGLPLLIGHYGAHAAVLGSIGMLCGYCGTLMTPMAADFNLVPAALLELRNPYAVIRAQLPVAFALLAINLALLWWLALPH